MLVIENVAEVLGLPRMRGSSSAMGFVARIEDGLPIAALDRVARIVSPGDSQFKYRLVPRATYERRKGSKLLSKEEGTRLARLARVWGVAVDVWGSDAEAREFLFRPHAMVEDRRPVDAVIQSEFGAEMVLEILGSLKYGSAA